MKSKNLAYQLVFVILIGLIGLTISFSLSAWTVWYTLRHEATNELISWRSWADMEYAYGSGRIDNRWVVDIDWLSFGVYVATLTDYTGFDSTQSVLAEKRSGPDTIPYWSRGKIRPEPGNRFDRIYEVAGGFPFISWKAEVRIYSVGKKSEVWCGFPPTMHPKYPYPITIPYCPVLPGGLLNAAFWGAAFYVLLRAPLKLRRSIIRIWRKRQHRCPNCAYNIRGLTTCPECGEAVTPPKGVRP